MLFLGMGTEIFVFFLSAFDRPFDKTADGKDLPTHIDEEEIEEEYEEDMAEREAEESGTATHVAQPAMAGVPQGGTIIIGGGVPSSGAASAAAGGNVSAAASAATEPSESSEMSESSSQPAQQPTMVNMPQWVAQQQQVSPEMAEATDHYVEELNKLTEMLSKVSEQSQRLTRDSEEMENLNRTLTGICKVYEMQLKGASAQIGTIDQINEQSRKMAGQIEQLNAIYARMIEAMTVNMNGMKS